MNQDICPVCHQERDEDGLCACSEGVVIPNHTTTLSPVAQINFEDEGEHPELNVSEG